ncbi:MAG: patatin-like phospholipase family protein [Gemmataceae bacterium]
MPPLRHLTGSARPAVLLALGLTVWVVGCKSPKPDPNPPPHYLAPVVTDLSPTAEPYPPTEREVATAMAAGAALRPPAAHARPLNVLALSGGGQYGSYAAGLLIGWTARGDRPQFDVVTGISSGALLAPMAFLGPKYDPVMQRVFSTLKTEQVFKYKPILVHIIRDKSLATSDPLRDLIAEVINDEFLCDLRAAHAAGRRLFIGTINLHTRRMTVWDLGAVASGDRPDRDDLVRKILLASSSIPGLTRPVELAVEVNGACVTELHGDAGGVSQTFVKFGAHHPRPDPADPTAKWLAGSNLYAIAGGKLYLDPLKGEIGFIARASGAVSATLYALFRADLWRLYGLCATSGMRFHLAAVPREIPIPSGSTTFDPELQLRLFTTGYDQMKCGNPWRPTPPGVEPGEEEFPRTGLRFTVP